MFDENKLRFQIIPDDKEIVTSLERLKYASFDALNDEITVSLGEFSERNMTGLMALYENEIVAGCFVCKKRISTLRLSFRKKNSFKDVTAKS